MVCSLYKSLLTHAGSASASSSRTSARNGLHQPTPTRSIRLGQRQSSLPRTLNRQRKMRKAASRSPSRLSGHGGCPKARARVCHRSATSSSRPSRSETSSSASPRHAGQHSPSASTLAMTRKPSLWRLPARTTRPGRIHARGTFSCSRRATTRLGACALTTALTHAGKSTNCTQSTTTA